VDDAVAKVPQLRDLDRRACRQRVVDAFSLDRMIDGYVAAYRQALALRLPPAPSAAVRAARDVDYWERPMAFTDMPQKPATLFGGDPLSSD